MCLRHVLATTLHLRAFRGAFWAQIHVPQIGHFARRPPLGAPRMAKEVAVEQRRPAGRPLCGRNYASHKCQFLALVKFTESPDLRGRGSAALNQWNNDGFSKTLEALVFDFLRHWAAEGRFSSPSYLRTFRDIHLYDLLVKKK